LSLTLVHRSVITRYGHLITITRGGDSASVTACLRRDKEQGLAGSAMQSAPAYHITDEIAATALVTPKPKDKIVDGSQNKTINKVEEIYAADTTGKIIGWRLRVGG
jgi:hypothetical protein